MSVEVYQTLIDMGLNPTIILMKKSGVNPGSQKMEFVAEDVTEETAKASERILEVGER